MKRTTKQRLSRAMAAIMLISQFSPMGVYAASDDTGIEIVSEEAVEDAVEETGEESTVEAASEDAMDEASVEVSAADEDTANDADSEDAADAEADSEEDAAVSDTEADSEDDETASDEEAADPEDEMTEEEIEEDLEEVEFYDEEVVEVEDEEPERLGKASVQAVDDNYYIYPHYNESFTLEVEVTKDDDAEYTYAWYKGSKSDSNKLDSTTELLTVEEGVSANTTYYFYVTWQENGAEKYARQYFYVYPTNDFEAYVKDTEATSAEVAVAYEESATLSVTASAYDAENITYQWYGPNGTIEGATDSEYTIDAVTEKGNWSCKVYDGHSYNYVYFYITIDNSFIAYPDGEETTATYKNVNVLVGDDVTLKVIAESTEGDITYNWGSYYDSDVSGDTDSLTLTDVTAAATYYCSVSDSFGNSKTLYFYIKLDNEFSIKAYVNDEEKEVPGSSYTNIEVKEDAGTKVELKVEGSAHEDSKMTYQWSVRSLNSYGYTTIEDATGKTYTPETSGYYRCIVSDGYSNNSLTAVFYVVFENEFNAYPDGEKEDASSTTIAVKSGSDAELKVIVSGKDTSDITYSWTNSNGDDLSNETKDTLTVSNVTSKVTYYCAVKDKYGSYKRLTFNVTVDNGFVVKAYVDGEEKELSASSSYSYIYAYPEGGKDVELKVEASAYDKSQLEYEWYDDLNNKTIENVTDGTYKPERNGTYRCTVKDGYSSKSVYFYVTFENAFEAHPDGEDEGTLSTTIAVKSGSNAQLKVVVSGKDTTGVTYTWSNDKGDDLSNETKGALTVSNVTTKTVYSCYVKDQYGSYRYITFNVIVANGFTAYPDGEAETATSKSVEVLVGEDVTLKVVATSTDNKISYQWKKKAYSYSYSAEALEGETDATLKLEKQTATGYTYYCCTVSDQYGNTKDINFTVSVTNKFSVYPDGVNPDSNSIYITEDAGNTVKLDVIAKAHDSSKMTYEWSCYKNGVIEGAIKPSYSVTTSDTYTCTVSDGYGSSKTVYFHVTIDNAFRAYPDGNDEFNPVATVAVKNGSDAVLKVATEGTDLTGVTYSWSNSAGDDLSQEKGASLTVSNVTSRKEYYCVVSDKYGSSEQVSFVVIVANGFEAYPEGASEGSEEVYHTVKFGKDITLKVIAKSDDKNLTFMWFKDGEALEENTEKLVLTGVKESTTYWCSVSDQYNNSRTLYFYVTADNEFVAYPEGYYDGLTSLHLSVKADETPLKLKVFADALDKDKLEYSWQDYYGTVAQATEDTLEVSKSGTYYCNVTDGYTLTKTIYFYVTVANELNAYPEGAEEGSSTANISVAAKGETATLKVVADAQDKSDLTYEWSGSNAVSKETGDTVKVTVDKNTTYYCTVSDKYGNSKRLSFVVKVSSSFVAFPEGEAEGTTSKSITVKSTDGELTLRVITEAEDKESLKFRWTQGGYTVLAEKTDTLKITGQPYTYYTCTVSDANGNSVSITFYITIDNEFYAYPAGAESKETARTEVTVKAGGNEVLEVTAEALTGELHYSWSNGDSDSNKLVVSKSGTYTCTVRDDYNHSKIVTFYVTTDSGFEAYPEGAESGTIVTKNVAENEAFTLKAIVRANDEQSISYKWTKDRTDNAVIGKEASLSVEGISRNTTYYCKVSDTLGNSVYLTYNVVIYDNEFRAWASGYDSNIAAVTVEKGEELELKTEVRGKDLEGVTYAWRTTYYGSDIAGEKSATLKLASVTESGGYFCMVKDAYGNSVDIQFIISVNVVKDYQVYAGDKDVTSTSVVVKPGENAVLKVRVASEKKPELKYYWYDPDGNAMSGNTDSRTIAAEEIQNGRQYRCEVRDTDGNMTHLYFTIRIDNGFSAYVAGTEDTYTTVKALADTTVELAVDAKSNDGELTYKWVKDGDPIQDAVSSTLKIKAEENTCYYCYVKDSYGNGQSIYFYIRVRNRFMAYPEGTKLDTAYITVPAGKDAVLKVDVEGTDLEDVTYSWSKNNSANSRYGLYDTYDPLDSTTDSWTAKTVKEAAKYRCVVKDAFGNSAIVYFEVDVDNQFVVKAASDTEQTVAPNTEVKLSVSVAASDKEGITYKWIKSNSSNGVSGTETGLNGADSDTVSVKAAETSYYYCVVKDAYGNSEQVKFHVTVDNAFEAYVAGYDVKKTSDSVYVDYGESATLEVAVEAADKSQLTYTWVKGGRTDLSATGAKLVVDEVKGYVYCYCDVDDGYGNKTTIYFYLYVNNNLTLEADGETEITVKYGDPVTLAVKVEADDTSELKFNFPNVSNSTEKVDGTKASLTINEVKRSGSYYVSVDDQYGNHRYVQFFITVENNLSAKADAELVTVEYGKDATLKVIATANETKGITYSWSGYEYDTANGSERSITLADTDEATLTIKNVCRSAKYKCIVRDAFGNSKEVEITVKIDNNLKVEASNVSVKYGESATISTTVTAGNKEGITYEWFKESTNSNRIVGEKDSSLKLNNVKESHYYYCRVTDIYGNTAYTGVDVTVENEFSVKADGNTDFVVAKGGKVTMKVAASATSGDITYTWRRYLYNTNTGQWNWDGELKGVATNSYTATVDESTKFICWANDKYNNTGSVEFIVRIEGEELFAVTGVTLDKKELTLAVGDTATLTETVVPRDADNKKVTWTSSKPAVATVDEKGNVKAVAAGTATITVKTEDGGFTATCEVTVADQLTPVTGVTLDKKTLEMETGDKAVLTATVAPEGASNKKVSWSSDKADVAKVDEKGNVTAVTAGTAKITVTTEDGEFTDTCEVTVTAKEVPVEGVSLNKNKLSLVIGDKYTLAAAVKPMDASNQNVSWTTSDEAVATVNENGEVTAVAAGKATITVTTEDGEQKAVCEVTVTEEAVALTGITVDQEEVTLKEGETATLIVSMVPEDATEQKVVFSSSDGAVASVDQDGTITAVAAGKATITVKTEDEAFSATCEVTVEAATTVTSVSLNEAKLELVVGKTAQLVATVEPEDAQNKEVTWTIDKPAVATVDENGKVTAVAAGKATITVTTVDGELTATCEVTVNKKTEISGNTFSLEQAAKGVPVINNSDYTLKIERNEKGAIVSATIYGPDDKVAKEIDSYIANIVTEYDTDGKTPKTFYSLVFTDGQWDIKYDSGTKGAYKYLGVEYFVAGGVVNQNANGLIYTGADGWRFLAAGHVVTGHKGLVMYANEWFWIDDEGRCDDTYAAIVKWNGANFLVHGGRLRTDYTGFTYDPQNTKVWYHITNGQVWGEGEITDISIEGGEITRNCVNGAVVG